MSLPSWALDWILEAEGGFSDDPDDSGGMTKFGISHKAYPALDIANLTKEEAGRIYQRDYWDAVKAGEMPESIALAVFDGAVISGPVASVRWLQTIMDVNVDGVVGAETLRAVWAREVTGQTLVSYLARRAVHFAEITRQRVSQRKYERGWYLRLFRLQARCLSLPKGD